VPRPPLPLPDPPLRGPDHLLRPWGGHPGDAAALARAWQSPDLAARTRVPEGADEATARRWIGGEAARRDAGAALDLVLADPDAPATVLGEVGLVVVDAERGWAEVGWWLLPEARGRGRASAAVDGLAGWALAHLALRRLFARIPADHPASAAVARRAGFTRVGVAAGGVEVHVRDRPGGR